jgi:hypothetical protein
VELQGKYKEMDELKRQEETRQQKFINAREELAAAELELKNLDPFVPPKDELVSVLLVIGCYYLYLCISTIKGKFFLKCN